MPRNIEIKARVDDIEALKMAAAAIADQGPAELEQDDTFFRCDAGRLKLRVFAAIPSRRPFLKIPKLLDDVCHSAVSAAN
jgi:hypothetical protein